MARLSDIIENFIKSLLQESEGILELQRNELADYFDCAPSQINYVLATRFSIDQGYYIESRRGGGGFIKIVKLDIEPGDYIHYLITEKIGDRITQRAAETIVTNIQERGIINEREASIMKAALSDKVISIPSTLKENVRANILKAMLLSININSR